MCKLNPIMLGNLAMPARMLHCGTRLNNQVASLDWRSFVGLVVSPMKLALSKRGAAHQGGLPRARYDHQQFTVTILSPGPLDVRADKIMFYIEMFPTCFFSGERARSLTSRRYQPHPPCLVPMKRWPGDRMDAHTS